MWARPSRASRPLLTQAAERRARVHYVTYERCAFQLQGSVARSGGKGLGNLVSSPRHSSSPRKRGTEQLASARCFERGVRRDGGLKMLWNVKLPLLYFYPPHLAAKKGSPPLNFEGATRHGLSGAQHTQWRGVDVGAKPNTA